MQGEKNLEGDEYGILPYGQMDRYEKELYHKIIKRLGLCVEQYIAEIEYWQLLSDPTGSLKFTEAYQISLPALKRVALRFVNDRKKYRVLHGITVDKRISERKVAASLVQWVYLEKPLFYPDNSAYTKFKNGLSQGIYSGESASPDLVRVLEYARNPSIGLAFTIIQHLRNDAAADTEAFDKAYSIEWKIIKRSLVTGSYTQSLAEAAFNRIYEGLY